MSSRKRSRNIQQSESSSDDPDYENEVEHSSQPSQENASNSGDTAEPTADDEPVYTVSFYFHNFCTIFIVFIVFSQHFLQNKQFKKAMTACIRDYVAKTGNFRSNLIINGHSTFLVVTLVCSTPECKTVFYVDAARSSDTQFTPVLAKSTKEFLQQFGIIPSFVVTDAYGFNDEEGFVLDLVHASNNVFKLISADMVNPSKKILQISRDVMMKAMDHKPLQDKIAANKLVIDGQHGRGERRFDPEVFSALMEVKVRDALYVSVPPSSEDDKQTSLDKFNNHNVYMHHIMKVFRLIWQRFKIQDEIVLKVNAAKIVEVSWENCSVISK